MNYPKILVINGQSIYRKNATAITLQSILSTWPKNKLMEIHITSGEICIPAEFIEMKSIKVSTYTFPLRTLTDLHFLKKANNALKKDSSPDEINEISQSITKKEIFRQFFFTITDLSYMHINKSLKKTISDFKPDVIYTLGGSVSVIKLSVYFSKLLKINIVPHFMDNWQECLQWDNNKSLVFYKSILDSWLKKLYKRTVTALAISPQMAIQYSNRWGIKHYTLMNSIDVDTACCKENVPAETFIMIYTGGLHLGRWKALVQIADAIATASEELNRKVLLRIYTSMENCEKYKKYFDSNLVEFMDFVAHNEIKSVYEKADVLVHTEVDNPQMMGFFKYSISTKIPEYLSSNRPILFYGPKDLYLFKYLSESNAAYSVSEKIELANSIKQLVTDKELRNKLVQNAKELAYKNHNRIICNNIFNHAIIDSVRDKNKYT